MIRTAYLRAYQPLAAFPPGEREQWVSQSRDGEAVDSSAARKWLIATALPSGEPMTGPAEGAFVRKLGEQVLVCPWRTRLRMLASLLAFRTSVPDEVAEAFVPERVARRAAHELSILGERHPDVRSHILHANWHVPLRWFVPFDDSERILTEDAEGLRIRYEVRLGEARERMARALEILESSWVDETVTGAVRELAEWLEEFSDDGLLELDYGAVAGMFPDDDLLEDRSAADVWACLEALTSGDVLKAGRVFQSLTDRWAEVRAHEVMN